MNDSDRDTVYPLYVNVDESSNLMLMRIFLGNMDMNVGVHLEKEVVRKKTKFDNLCRYLNEPVYVFEDEQIV